RRQRAAAPSLHAHGRLVERKCAANERDTYLMRTGFDGHRELQHLGAALRARASRRTFQAGRADRAGGDALAVDRNLDLVRLPYGARHLDVKHVLRVERKIVLDEETAARAERQSL